MVRHKPGIPRRRPAGIAGPEWLTVTVATVCAALFTLLLTDGPHQRGVHLVVVFVVCAPVLALRRWPLPVLAVVTVTTAIVMTGGDAPLPFGIVLGLAAYIAASRLPRRVSVPAVAISATAIAVALIYAAFTTRNDGVPGEAVAGYLPLAAGWFIGDSTTARRRYQAGLAEQARKEQAVEAERARQQIREERVRIARELHDVVAHTLAVMTVQAGVGRRLMAKRPEAAGSALESIETIGLTAQEELRVVLGLLRDEEHRTAALAPAPKLVDLKELADTVRASGIPVDLHISGTDRPLSPALELSVYRVVQEALTNVVKHAPGARAIVDLAVREHEIRLDVTDDGAPAEQRTERQTGGHGIVGMRERIAAFGGRLTAEPLAGRGFRVSAQVPIEGAM